MPYNFVNNGTAEVFATQLLNVIYTPIAAKKTFLIFRINVWLNNYKRMVPLDKPTPPNDNTKHPQN